MKKSLATRLPDESASPAKKSGFLEKISKALFSPNDTDYSDFLESHSLLKLDDGDYGTKTLGFKQGSTNDYFTYTTKISMEAARTGDSVKIKLQHQNLHILSDKTPPILDVLVFEGNVNEENNTISPTRMEARNCNQVTGLGADIQMTAPKSTSDANQNMDSIPIKKIDDYLLQFRIGRSELNSLKSLLPYPDEPKEDGNEFRLQANNRKLRELFPIINHDENGIYIAKDVIKYGSGAHLVPNATPDGYS